MATVITSIGSKGTTGNPVNGALTMISGGSGSGTPWTGTVKFSTSPTANVGDKLYFENVYHPGQFGSGCEGGGTADVVYLITGVSGDTLTVKYISGAYSTTSPYDIKSDSFCTTAAQPYVVRFYSTIDTWESGCDETALYSNGDTAQGECYADSALSVTAQITFDAGNVTDIAKQVLTVPVGQRHDGTADSGFKVNVAPSDTNPSFFLSYHGGGAVKRTIEWIEIDGGDTDQNWGTNWSIIEINTGGLQAYAGTVSHTLIHGCHNTREGHGNSYGMIGGISAYSYIHNNIVYDCSGKRRTPGIGVGSGIVTNNTVYKIGMTDDYGGADSNEAIGIRSGSSINTNKNNIAIGTYVEDPSGDGEKHDYLGTGTGTVGTYNISGDSTASGSDSFTSITAASIFISTTSGSEDLHILRSSKAVGAADDLGTGVSYNAGHGDDTAAGGSDYGTPLNRDINNGDRNVFAMAWDIGASQNSIIAKIGTNSRDYSTVAAWTALLDDDDYYGAGSVARGECYADTAFTACYLENGFTIGLTQLVLTAADGQQHDGTAGSGVVFNMSTTAKRQAGPGGSAYISYGIFSFLEFTQSGTMNDHHWAVAGWGNSGLMEVHHCLIHGYDLQHSGSSSIMLLEASGGSNGDSMSYHNNICYDLTRGIVGSQNCTLYGIKIQGGYAGLTNNTVYNIHADSTDGSITQSAVGIEYEKVNSRIKNNIAMGLSSANGTTTGMVCGDGSPTHANNNMVNDTSETGTSSQTSKSSSGQFVSTTTGSEDLHLVVGSDAIGNGADLGLSTDATGFSPPNTGNYVGLSKYVLGQNYDINGGNRHAFSMAWDIGASQYEIIAKIGTTSRDFSTINAWEAQLDNTDYYGKGSRAKGECYKDSDFQMTGALAIDGGGTVDLLSRTLTVAVGQRHDGTANTGVRLLRSTDSDSHFITIDSSVGSAGGTGNQIEWLEFDANEKGVRSIIGCAWYCGVQNCLVHSGRWISGGPMLIGIGISAKNTWAANNIVYDLYLDNGSSAATGVWGIYNAIVDWIACVNNTVYNIRTNSSDSNDVSQGIYIVNGWYDPLIFNNIVMGTTSDNGASPDFGTTYGTQTNVVSNYTSDDTATGVDYQHDQSASDTFVSCCGGSIDLHLKDGSNALRAGKDVGTSTTFQSRRLPYSPYVWDVDINGRSRDAEGDDWDIGAHQCEDCSEGGAVTNTAFMFFVD